MALPDLKSKFLILDGGMGTVLQAMGLTKGTQFEIKRVAPMGDPVEIIVKGYSLALRRDEALALLVEQEA